MGLLTDIQAEIETRMLHSGGWSGGNGNSAAIETTCYALMASADEQARTRRKAIDVLLKAQNLDGSWPAFEGDDPEGCWTTSLALITFRCLGLSGEPIDRAVQWLLDNKGREGHWFWKWKFRIADRAVHFNPDKYGWAWFPGTVSWVVPTAFSLVALKQSFACCRTGHAINRIQLGTEMLRDRACPQGGWNAGNGIVFGSALIPHVDTTAIALLALTDDTDAAAVQGLDWLRQASVECSSAYSLAWSSVAFVIHQDQALDPCIAKLLQVLSSRHNIPSVETLCLAAIALKITEGDANPFQVVI